MITNEAIFFCFDFIVFLFGQVTMKNVIYPLVIIWQDVLGWNNVITLVVINNLVNRDGVDMVESVMLPWNKIPFI